MAPGGVLKATGSAQVLSQRSRIAAVAVYAMIDRNRYRKKSKNMPIPLRVLLLCTTSIIGDPSVFIAKAHASHAPTMAIAFPIYFNPLSKSTLSFHHRLPSRFRLLRNHRRHQLIWRYSNNRWLCSN